MISGVQRSLPKTTQENTRTKVNELKKLPWNNSPLEKIADRYGIEIWTSWSIGPEPRAGHFVFLFINFSFLFINFSFPGVTVGSEPANRLLAYIHLSKR